MVHLESWTVQSHWLCWFIVISASTLVWQIIYIRENSLSLVRLVLGVWELLPLELWSVFMVSCTIWGGRKMSENERELEEVIRVLRRMRRELSIHLFLPLWRSIFEEKGFFLESLDWSSQSLCNSKGASDFFGFSNWLLEFILPFPPYPPSL